MTGNWIIFHFSSETIQFIEVIVENSNAFFAMSTLKLSVSIGVWAVHIRYAYMKRRQLHVILRRYMQYPFGVFKSNSSSTFEGNTSIQTYFPSKNFDIFCSNFGKRNWKSQILISKKKTVFIIQKQFKWIVLESIKFNFNFFVSSIPQ